MDRRTRTGCLTCRRRRVKCDETKPFCNRCRSANFVCGGYEPPRQAPEDPAVSASSSAPEGSPLAELSWRHTNWRQEQLPLYHHFVTTTALRLFRNDHVSFWRDQVAQMSYGLDVVYEALLAIGAVHRSSLLACQYGNSQEALKIKVLGLRAYGNTIRLLPSHLGQDTTAEIIAALVVLTLLTCFECFLENANGAFRHLWAAIQLLQRSEERLTSADISDMAPLYDAMLRLDFIAQKLIPYACSSFVRCPDLAFMESPFWNRPSLEFSGITRADRISTERHRLIQLICGHNKINRVIWGGWYPLDERPSREELMGFYSEMLLWKANSPATFESCEALDSLATIDIAAVDSLYTPPPAVHFASSEAAVNVMMYNGYLGCAVAMISTTDEDPASRDREAFRLVYQNLCITAGLIERHREGLYKPCDAVSMGISLFLYHGVRRCYSLAWQKWTIGALRSIGREGLSNGFTSANASELMCELEAKMRGTRSPSQDDAEDTLPLGPTRDRLIPLLMPRGDDGQHLAFYLRYGFSGEIGDERAIQVVSKAIWREDETGVMNSLELEIYDSVIDGQVHSPARPQALGLFHSWRQEVERGWHGYLGKEVQDGFLQREGLPNV